MDKVTVIFEILYVVVAIIVTLKIIYDTHNPVKTLGYILLVIFLPVIGILFYFSFGVNYRKSKLYKRKIIKNKTLYESVNKIIFKHSVKNIKTHTSLLEDKNHFAQMMIAKPYAMLYPVNDLKLLINGEHKFPEICRILENAKDHIHIEYYIYEDDEIGNQIKDILIRKAKEGVEVRFIYDDFGSRDVRKHVAKQLKSAGVKVYPFYKIKIPLIANRMNYRNHRKIIIVDGIYGFVGGINVEDKYINNGKYPLYWRDTHLMIQGASVAGLQYVFINDWNFCAEKEAIELAPRYSPKKIFSKKLRSNSLIQIVDSGPDSDRADIMLMYMGAIASATKRIYITTPYFIPNETIINALKFAALKGIDTRLLVPCISDSKLVNLASRSNYEELLEIGVRIYRYKKGFVHAKTMVVDDNISIIGSANMDIRSYDLNFEINALVFDKPLNKKLASSFFNDLSHSEEIDKVRWKNRSKWIRFAETFARLFSPLL